MESATSTTRTLEIDGMSGDACVKKVTGALRGVPGVTTESVKVGEARIGADKAGCHAACAAIKGAGYQAKEDSGSDEDKGSTDAQSKAPSDQKGGSQGRAPGQNAGNDRSASGNGGYGAKGSERSDSNASGKPAGTKN